MEESKTCYSAQPLSGREKDPEIRERLIMGNLGLVYSVLYRLGIPVGDADSVQNGIVGLIRAVDKFDASKGFAFTSYATKFIEGSIREGRADASGIRKTSYFSGRISKLIRASNELKALLHREPLDEEIAQCLGWSVETVVKTRVSSLQISCPILLDDKIPDGDGTCFKDQLPDGSEGVEAYLIRQEQFRKLRQSLNRLDEKEQYIVMQYFGFHGPNRSFREIGEILGFSKERVRQIHLRSLEKLKKYLS